MNSNALKSSLPLALVGVTSVVALLIICTREAILLPSRAAFFPQALLGLIGLSFVVILAVEIGRKWRSASTNSYALGSSAYAAAAVLLAGAFAIPFLGFYLTTTLLHFVLYLICVRSAAMKQPLREALSGLKFALFMSAINWLVFDYLLELAVPTGFFF